VLAALGVFRATYYLMPFASAVVAYIWLESTAQTMESAADGSR